MAGIFGFFDYTKPGPGVPKDAPPKPRIVVFFEIFSRKFWHLVKLNMLFSIFNLPAILMVLFLILASQSSMNTRFSEDLFADFVFRFLFGAVLLCIPLITVGPAQAGFTYVLRNYAREEHAFIWEDFKEHALKNFKESMIISAIDFIVVLIIWMDISIYMSMDKSNILISIASALLILSFVIYLMMHMYIYPMLVTFKLNIKQIYKNAFIFTIMKFLPNVGILLLCAFVIMLTFYFPILGFMLFPFITMSTLGLITNFHVYPYLKKYMMDRLPQQESAGEPEEQDNG